MSYSFTLRPDRPYAEFHVDVINWCLGNVGPLSCYNLTDSVFSGDGWSLSGADRYTAMHSWQHVVQFHFRIDDEYKALAFKLVWGEFIVTTAATNAGNA